MTKLTKVPDLKLEFESDGTLTEESWNRLLNYYEDNNEHERRKNTLVPKIKRIDKISEELKKKTN